MVILHDVVMGHFYHFIKIPIGCLLEIIKDNSFDIGRLRIKNTNLISFNLGGQLVLNHVLYFTKKFRPDYLE